MTALPKALALAVGLLTGATAPAVANGFASPSGNIVCYFHMRPSLLFDEVPLTCLVFEAAWDLPSDYGDDDPTCDLDQTRTVILPPTGAATARWSCHGDVFWPLPLGAISYGSTWSLPRYTCTMATDGVRCANQTGNTMHIRRSALTLE